jgi:flagellin-like protein
MMERKAEMGVGTLIIFIAMLLVAAVAAGVLIQTAGSLQEKSLATGQQAEAQIATNAESIEVSASDGRGGNLTDFQQFMKLSPGSDPIKLEQVILTFNTQDNGASLKYRGPDSICENNNLDGYNTWTDERIIVEVNTTANSYRLAEDLDDDQQDDYVYVSAPFGGASYLYFNLSTAGLLNVSLGADISDTTPPVAVDVSDLAVTNGTDIFAYATVQGTASVDDTVSGNNMTFIVTPYKLGEGYFSVVYEQEGTNWVNGNMQRGDVVRLCYEAPRAVTEDEEIRLNFIPKVGTATLTQFVTPDVISTERVYLYP